MVEKCEFTKVHLNLPQQPTDESVRMMNHQLRAGLEHLDHEVQRLGRDFVIEVQCMSCGTFGVYFWFVCAKAELIIHAAIFPFGKNVSK